MTSHGDILTETGPFVKADKKDLTVRRPAEEYILLSYLRRSSPC